MNKSIISRLISGILIVTLIIGVLCAHNVTEKGTKACDKYTDEPIEFTYNSSALDDAYIKLENKAVFDPVYFCEKSTEYNHGLAVLSLNMSLASSTTVESLDNWGDSFDEVCNTKSENIDYSTNRNGYMIDVYKKLGFYNDVYYKYNSSLNDATDTAAYSIAMKKIKINKRKYNIVMAMPRSVTYGAEWGSNFVLRNEDGMSGFEASGKILYEGIRQYLKDNHLGSNTKVWLAGFSRGAAVANIAAAYLDRGIENREVRIAKDNVYAYTFATPKGVMDEDAGSDRYDNIFNVILEADIVATVAPSSYGFKRYGRVLEIPHIYASSNTLKRIEKGKKVDLSDEDVDLIKKVSNEYNIIRHQNALNEDKEFDMNTLFKGFAVGEEFSQVLEIAFSIAGDDVDDYVREWQDTFEDIVPFVISQSKKYSQEQGKWVRYDTLAEYLSDIYGEDIINQATEAGVFSQTEYNKKLEMAYELMNKNIIDEETVRFIRLLVDTYYGVRIVAIKNNVDIDSVKYVTSRAYDRAWEMINKARPIKDAFYCKTNHYGETYLAWMKNYNPYLEEVIS